jgi:molybdate transport system substrate-binding protein
MRPTRALAAAVVLAACAALAGCGGGDGGQAATATPSGTVTVFAAASLTAAFEAMEPGFTKANPGLRPRFNFAGSQALATQILEGAPADAFASADARTMARVADAGRVDGTAEVFAGNELQIAVARGNPRRVTGLADLARPGLKVVLAAPQVPAGRYAAEALARAGVTARPVSLEDNVKAVVTKVGLGEADAGIVYVTDVTAAGDELEGVAIADDQNVPASYPIAALTQAPNPAGGRAFAEYVRSAAGQATLARFGFLPGDRA